MQSRCEHGFRGYVDNGYCKLCDKTRHIEDLQLEIVSLKLTAMTPSAKLLEAYSDIATLSHDVDILVMCLKMIGANGKAKNSDAAKQARQTLDRMIGR